MSLARWFGQMPWSVVCLAMGLTAAGSLCIARAAELSGGADTLWTKQIVWATFGLAAMLASTTVNYRQVARWSYPLFALSLLGLVAVFFAPSINGAHRWLRLGPVGFQPSEFAKLAYVLALSRYLMYRANYRRLRGLVVPLAVTLVPLLLILKEPDLGTALVFLPVLFLMLFAAGAKSSDLALVGLLGVMLLPVLWSQMSHEQRSRITALAEQTGPGEKPTADGYHLHQAKQMHALGGLSGSLLSGDVTTDRAVYHLPEAPTDFVFCIAGERFGLVGSCAMLLCYALLLWRCQAVALATREPFGRLVAVGVLALFAVEVCINTAMTVGLAPITGLSLPLVSYGGSGLLTHLLALGMVLNVGLRPGYEVTREPFRFVAGARRPRAARGTFIRT